jgi:nucleoside-diphosphate-sugar epimerase
MVAIEKGSLVLVTGASGFIATYIPPIQSQSFAEPRRHVVRELLRAGFKVRGTVRSASKGEYLMDLSKDEGEFQYAIVADMGRVSGKHLNIVGAKGTERCF